MEEPAFFELSFLWKITVGEMKNGILFFFRRNLGYREPSYKNLSNPPEELDSTFINER